MSTPLTFEKKFFQLTPTGAKEAGPYDVIIVGAGFGGGVLAADLFDKNKELKKKILVIERGNLAFTTHCLNTARSGGTGDSGQQNDNFFQGFRSEYEMNPDSSPHWIGGPMYTLGGRSNAWGLFIPRPHRHILDDFFPTNVVNDLRGTYFQKAESLMNIGFPETRPVHQRLIDTLNVEDGVNWQWGRIASEFSRDTNFGFARGAYGTVDKLLEIAMVNPVDMGDPTKDVNFRILLNAEVLRLQVPGSSNDLVGVTLRDGTVIEAKKVVLSAGSVNTPAILLRNELVPNPDEVLKLTDHAMYLVQRSYSYSQGGKEIERPDVGAMKIQTFTTLGSGERYRALANFAVDSSQFLSRSIVFGPWSYNHNFTMVFILPCELVENNKIELKSDEPFVTINRPTVTNDSIPAMVEIIKKVEQAMKDEIGVEFDDSNAEQTPEKQLQNTEINPLKLGNVAHELGSLPMRKTDNDTGVVDENLALIGSQNVYICDLSVFPVSPAANPSLTLAALALRLGDHLSQIL